MNILYLQHRLDKSCGITRFLLTLTQNLPEDMNPSVLVFGGNAIDRFTSKNINVKTFNRDERSFFSRLLFPFYLFWFILKNNIDVIHSNHRYFDALTYIMKPFIRSKNIFTVHSKVGGRKLFSYKSKYLVSVSESIKEHLVSHFGVKKEKVAVIRNFLDPQTIKIQMPAAQLKKNLNIDESTYVFTFIGRFNAEKGINILLEAYEKFQYRNKDTVLLMIGSGDEKKYAEDYVEEKGLNAVILDPVDSIYDYYNISDAVILPSRTEPFSLVMLETGYMGRLLIASSVDGTPELIRHNENGLLFEPENSDDLAVCMARSYKEKAEMEKLADNLNREILEKYAVKDNINKYIHLYRKITGSI